MPDLCWGNSWLHVFDTFAGLTQTLDAGPHSSATTRAGAMHSTMFATSGPGALSSTGACPPASWGIKGSPGTHTLTGTMKRTEELHGTHASVPVTWQRPRTAQSCMAASNGRAATPQVLPPSE